MYTFEKTADFQTKKSDMKKLFSDRARMVYDPARSGYWITNGDLAIIAAAEVAIYVAALHGQTPPPTDGDGWDIYGNGNTPGALTLDSMRQVVPVTPNQWVKLLPLEFLSPLGNTVRLYLIGGVFSEGVGGIGRTNCHHGVNATYARVLFGDETAGACDGPGAAVCRLDSEGQAVAVIMPMAVELAPTLSALAAAMADAKPEAE